MTPPRFIDTTSPSRAPASKLNDEQRQIDSITKARLSGQHQLAYIRLVHFLEAHPTSKHRADVLFTAGVIAMDHLHDGQAAYTHFSMYVNAYPNGALYQAALGRLIELLSRQAPLNVEEKTWAERYLARFPDGPRAGIAAQLLSATP